jgi:hypothetical protein
MNNSVLAFLHQKGDPTMKKKCPTCSLPSIQEHLFETPQQDQPAGKFISVYRVSLVKDSSVSFEKRCLSNSVQARPILRKLIEEHGQADREQFCGLLLNAKVYMGTPMFLCVSIFSSQQIESSFI